MCLLSYEKFTGFENWHLPYSLHKSAICKLWELEPDIMEEVTSHRFRSGLDPNIWLFSNWQYVSGDFYPRNPKIGTHFSLTGNTQKDRWSFKSNVKRHTKLLCLNDDYKSEMEFESGEKTAREFFESMLPEKSSFEI